MWISHLVNDHSKNHNRTVGQFRIWADFNNKMKGCLTQSKSPKLPISKPTKLLALVENILNTWHVSLSSTCETESKVAKNVFCHIWCKLWGGSVEKSSGKVQDPSPWLENLNFSIIWNTWHVPLSSTWTISDSKCNFHFDWDRYLIQILAW